MWLCRVSEEAGKVGGDSWPASLLPAKGRGSVTTRGTLSEAGLVSPCASRPSFLQFADAQDMGVPLPPLHPTLAIAPVRAQEQNTRDCTHKPLCSGFQLGLALMRPGGWGQGSMPGIYPLDPPFCATGVWLHTSVRQPPVGLSVPMPCLWPSGWWACPSGPRGPRCP